jgi:hypothetical protein
LEQCQTNLPALLSILHFLYKRRFKLRKAAEEKPELSVAPSTETEEQAFDTVLQAEVLDGPEASEAAPSSPVDSTRPTSSDEITPDDLAREARSISEGDPMTLFTKFVSHGQGCVQVEFFPCLHYSSDLFLCCSSIFSIIVLNPEEKD